MVKSSEVIYDDKIKYLKLRYKNIKIAGIICDDNFYLKASEFAKLLNCKSPANFIGVYVKPADKFNYGSLLTKLGIQRNLERNEKVAYWINETGIKTIIEKAPLDYAEKFGKWLFEKILPEAKVKKVMLKAKLENGENSIITNNCNRIEQIKENNIDTVKLIFEAMELTGLKDKNDVLWFRGNDCAKMLEYKDPNKIIQDNVNSEYKNKYKNLLDQIDTGKIPVTYHDGISTWISENGLYQLISKSKMPLAKKFQQWLYEDVIPTIRKTGNYSTDTEYCFQNWPLAIRYAQLTMFAKLNQTLLDIVHIISNK